MFNRITFFLLALLLPVFVHATDVNLAHLTVQDGLLNSTIYHAMQDSRGFIWFCTETGVSRYDGKHFENFTINEGLADNEIFKCFEDSKHRVWFLSYNGRLSFYLNGVIYNSDNAPYLAYPLSGAFLLQCVEDKWHNLWIATSYGSVIKIHNDTLTPYKPPFLDGNHSIYYISSILFNEKDSVKKFFLDQSTQDLYQQNLLSGTTTKIGKFPAVYKDKGKKVSKGFCNEKSILTINEKDFVSYSANVGWQLFDADKFGIKSHVSAFFVDGHYLWLASNEEGVFKIDMTTGELVSRLMQGEWVNKILKDAEQNIWFVTHDNGAFVLKSNAQLFTTLTSKTTFSVCCLKKDKKDYQLSGDNKGIVSVSSLGKITGSFNIPGHKFNRILDILPQGEGKAIIGCDGGLYDYDIIGGLNADRPRFQEGYKNSCIAPDSSIWVCCQNQLLKLTATTTERIYTTQRNEKYTAIGVLSDSSYYIGTTNKLYKVSNFGKEFRTILDDRTLKTQVTDIKILDDVLWVATHGNGIFILRDDKVMYHITKAKNGIVSDICQKLHTGNDHLVWIATNEGISVLNRDSANLVCNINSDIGIASNDIKNISADGERVYAATSAGMCTFRLTEVQVQSKPPAVYATRYKNGNKLVIDPPDKIEFDYFKGFITVSFTAITFQSASNLQYEYKFEDEPDWHRTPVTDIPLFSLTPGVHNLLFRAKKYNSAWSKPVLLSIIVNPLWYQTTWFKMAVGGLILVVVYFIIHTRSQRIRKKHDEENEYNRKIKELESKALISQMNPHFIFNSLNTVQQLILIKDEEQSLNFLSDFSMLIRRMLENSRKHLIPLSEEIDFLKRYLQLESIRFSNSFDYQINIDNNLAADDIKIPPVLIQPLLENAIKHGVSALTYRGLVQLTLRKENMQLVITVEDNGNGIYTRQSKAAGYSTKKESTALKVLEERLKLIKNDNAEYRAITILDKGQQGQGLTGTLIEIRIPIIA